MKRASVTFNVGDWTLSVSSDDGFLQLIDVPEDPIFEVRDVGTVAITFQLINPAGPVAGVPSPFCFAVWDPCHKPQNWVPLTPSGLHDGFSWRQSDGSLEVMFATSKERWVKEFRLSFVYTAQINGELTNCTVVIDPKIYNDGREP